MKIDKSDILKALSKYVRKYPKETQHLIDDYGDCGNVWCSNCPLNLASRKLKIADDNCTYLAYLYYDNDRNMHNSIVELLIATKKYIVDEDFTKQIEETL
jgi:hypothetical protein